MIMEKGQVHVHFRRDVTRAIESMRRMSEELCAMGGAIVEGISTPVRYLSPDAIVADRAQQIVDKWKKDSVEYLNYEVQMTRMPNRTLVFVKYNGNTSQRRILATLKVVPIA